MSKRNSTEKLLVGLTIGDVNGIGIEVIIKTFQDNRILSLCTPIIYGSSKAISYHRKALEISNFNFNIIKRANQANPKAVNIYNCWEEELPISLGESTDIAGEYAYIALDYAANDLKEGNIDILVTGPINKHSVQNTHKDFIGHTEFLTTLFQQDESLMLMISDAMRVGLVSNHVALRDAAAKVKKNRVLSKIKLLHTSMQQDFGIEQPKLAILGLNPHSGDQGLIGSEEQEEIIPAIEEAKEANILAYGPYAADGFFGSAMYKEFDAVLAMYHDQGLAPFKALSFGTGVNFTAGLPCVRTSPDHGTGYTIAGKNLASESSMLQAIFQGIDIYRQRHGYEEAHLNPVERTELNQETA